MPLKPSFPVNAFAFLVFTNNALAEVPFKAKFHFIFSEIILD